MLEFVTPPQTLRHGVLLTPGVFIQPISNIPIWLSMGVELVEGEPGVDEGYVWKRTTQGLKRWTSFYRRIDGRLMDRWLQGDPCWGFPD